MTTADPRPDWLVINKRNFQKGYAESTNKRPIIAYGIKYDSIHDAHRKIGKSTTWLSLKAGDPECKDICYI